MVLTKAEKAYSPPNSSISNLNPQKVNLPPINNPKLKLTNKSNVTTPSTESSFDSQCSNTSASKASENSLASLAKFVETQVKPLKSSYSQFATSYISTVTSVPDCLRCDSSDSYTVEPPPFKDPVKIEDFALREKRRMQLGDSLRKSKIIPSSKVILKEIIAFNRLPKATREDKNLHLFFKARQWCEVNKALVVDAKYPKTNPNAERDKYSAEHREATKRFTTSLTKDGRIMTRKEALEPFKLGLANPFSIPLELFFDEGVLQGHPEVPEGMVHILEQEMKDQDAVKQSIEEIIGKPVSLEGITSNEGLLEQPWQFQAKQTQLVKAVPKKKVPFKRTEYPPKSKEQKIADLRKLLPPPKPEHLQTDYLSGIWEPELMTDSFEITPLNYDSRLVDSDAKIDWLVVHDAKQKCENWLDSIPI